MRAAITVIAAFCALSASAPASELASAWLKASGRHFSRPHDLTLSPDGRYLYVADLGNHRVAVVDPETLEPVGVIGRKELASPHDVAFDRDGRLLVADTGNDRIAVYEVTGTAGVLVEQLRDGLGRPEGVAEGPDGRIYVTNVAFHNVVVLSGAKALASVGGPGSGPNEYRRPHDIEVDAQGRVYVADPGNDRIQILSPTLERLGALGGGDPYDFDELKYMKLDASGWLFVADQHNDRIKVYDAEHRPVAVLGSGKRGDGVNELNLPEGVEARGNRVWISDTYNGRMVLYELERSQ
ncbi:MAG: hypothetical protein GWN84_19090 [Gammaproteobacteria bacterium]|nr:hypothetical protein [Gammaproteobacteria bacterium]NIR84933.1 hypothetical protein [Gammaproteobacteria bacterium]NIR91782.1 hypothetical protein [Gammaproteobacteria bacterium]NIU05980.1 hypothetical protein [Gammaproteobacteria bacterium]NIV53027.1 hypothetical protein [Gammaproteobacteria bacterium]